MEGDGESSLAAAPHSSGSAPQAPLQPLSPPGTPRWRWCIHLGLLGAYPLLVGLTSFLFDRGETGPVLPGEPGGLLLASGRELGIFAVIFAMAWVASRASLDDLLLRWRRHVLPVLLGFAYSVGLRILIGLAAAVVLLGVEILGGDPTAAAVGARPQVERIVDQDALVHDPVYFAVMVTVVSFGLGGLREELWRAGVLAGFAAVFPRRFSGRRGMLLGAVFAALIFGLGHVLQGWGAVALTTLLGLGLGAIMALHRSIWEAVLAHGFFNATTFVLLYALLRFFPELLRAFGSG